MSRKAMLAKVHIGKKNLGWDEDTYRQVLEGRFGVQSAAALNTDQLAELCDYLKSQGVSFRPRDKKKDRQSYYPIPEKTPYARQKRYIAALWNKLGYDMDKLDTRVKKQFEVDKLVWLHDEDSLQTLAKDLYTRCRRRGLDPEPW
jgi:hypothetical protein